MALTMLLVSMMVFAVVEIAPGNVARNILGAYATPEQEKSMENQLGLDRHLLTRYVSWLFGSDWQVRRLIDKPLKRLQARQGTVKKFDQWWAVDRDGRLVQWKVAGGQLVKLVRQTDGSTREVPDDDAWQKDGDGNLTFWGIDTQNRAALWIKGQSGDEYQMDYAGWTKAEGAPTDYIPLTKGLCRGDAGISLQYKRPVSTVIGRRIINSAILAGLAFLFAMPLGVFLGMLAGLNEGRLPDRIISMGGLVTAASPDFATGILLIMLFSVKLNLLPGAAMFLKDSAILTQPQMLVLPVLTASLVEIGYILRITRSSVVEVMHSNYVRTAVLKGLSYRKVVAGHVLRNSLLAPVTVIMLHVNWLIGGLVVVESVFGFPGLGTFILNAAFYKDVYAIEAGAMVLIVLAVGSQLVADFIYSMLNPRIRYE